MAKQPKHNHREAFWLMLYTCKDCGHKEKIWNSRDGVTPFGTTCTICGEMDMIHTGPSTYEPDFIPQPGQYIWITFPQELRGPFGRGRVAAADGTQFQVDDPKLRQEVAQGVTDGLQPGEPFRIRWFPPSRDGEYLLLQHELNAMYKVMVDLSPPGFPFMEYDSGAEALHAILSHDGIAAVDLDQGLPDAAAITTAVINEWLEQFGTWPLTISISKLSLAVVEALHDAIAAAYHHGLADGTEQERADRELEDQIALGAEYDQGLADGQEQERNDENQ